MKPYRIWIFLLSAFVLTLLLKGKAAHPGLVLGLVSLISGGLVWLEALKQKGKFRMMTFLLGVFMEIGAVVVLNIENDPMENRLATLYGIFASLIIIDLLLQCHVFKK